jgi:hypothetical protein
LAFISGFIGGKSWPADILNITQEYRFTSR